MTMPSSNGHDRLRVFGVEPIGAHGGMSHFDLAFFAALAAQGVRVTWVTCDETPPTGGPYELWTAFRGIYGDAPAWRRGIRYALGLWAVLQRARGEVKTHPVVIHQQYVTVPALELAFVAAARWLGIPCILTPHDVTPYRQHAWGTQRLLPLLYRQYSALIAHSNVARAELQSILRRHGEDRIYSIPLGHLNHYWDRGPDIEPAAARARLGVPATTPVILFFGSIKKEKGLECLLRAMPLVLSRVPEALLLIAGRPLGADIAAFESFIDSLNLRTHVRARWEFVPDDELPWYYRAADVVALPYTRVYQSGVVLTAYAFGRAVVASAVGGLTEQVLDGRTGRLVPPDNPAALADALSGILVDRELAEAMGTCGRRWAASAFDWTEIVQQTLAVYDSVWRRRQL